MYGLNVEFSLSLVAPLDPETGGRDVSLAVLMVNLARQPERVVLVSVANGGEPLALVGREPSRALRAVAFRLFGLFVRRHDDLEVMLGAGAVYGLPDAAKRLPNVAGELLRLGREIEAKLGKGAV